MFGHAEGQIVLLCGCFPETADILVGADFHGIEAVKAGGKVEEMIVMRSLCHKESGTGSDILVHKSIRVEVFRLPEGADIFIAENGRVTVMSHMIEVLFGVLNVHIAGVPVAEHGNGLGTPVAPDAEFRIPEPIGTTVLTERFKGCVKHNFLSPSFVIYNVIVEFPAGFVYDKNRPGIWKNRLLQGVRKLKQEYLLLSWGRDYNPQNWFYNPSYVVSRIYYILGGKAVYKDAVRLREGYVYVFRAAPDFRVRQGAKNPVDHLFFDFITCRPLVDGEYIEIDPAGVPALQPLLEAFRQECERGSKNPDVGKAYLDLVIHSLEGYLMPGGNFSRVTSSVLNLMHTLPLAELTVRRIAAGLSMDEDYIIRCFKREIGCTPHRYLAFMKVDQAISYSRQGLCCTEIAERLGYGSLSSFSYFFKKETGQNLSEISGFDNIN